MGQNKMFFHELVKGNYGRKIAYADVEEVNEKNILDIVGDTLGTFYYNKKIADYLWRYYKGDQPVLYRTKICENHAYESVQFKVGQSYGEPMQCVGIVKEDINEVVDKFNTYLRLAHKHARNIRCGEWQSATGTGFLAAQFVKERETCCFGIDFNLVCGPCVSDYREIPHYGANTDEYLHNLLFYYGRATCSRTGIKKRKRGMV